jgi:uncharacterized protein (TIGR02453 family)
MSTSTSRFEGFGPGTFEFLSELGICNNKPWFEAHRDEFEAEVMRPARAFVVALGEALRPTFGGIVADPRTDRSIFRLHRDTRFSKDKSPFKSHLGMLLWEGDRPKMECSGFYIHLEPGRVMLGAGLYMIPRELLPAYRAAVASEAGRGLLEAVAAVEATGAVVDGASTKRVPAGWPADLPQSGLLKRTGLYAWVESEPDATVATPSFVQATAARLTAMAPIHRWLVANL